VCKLEKIVTIFAMSALFAGILRAQEIKNRIDGIDASVHVGASGNVKQTTSIENAPKPVKGLSSWSPPPAKSAKLLSSWSSAFIAPDSASPGTNNFAGADARGLLSYRLGVKPGSIVDRSLAGGKILADRSDLARHLENKPVVRRAGFVEPPAGPPRLIPLFLLQGNTLKYSSLSGNRPFESLNESFGPKTSGHSIRSKSDPAQASSGRRKPESPSQNSQYQQ
jgi:hypothetical protein